MVDYGDEVRSRHCQCFGHLGVRNRGIKVDLAKKTATDSFGDQDSLKNIEVVRGTKFDDRMAGDSKANELEGRAGADKLYGRDGNDLLIGGGGKDTLTGGNGHDAFRFDAAFGADNIDTIVKFKSGTDSLELENAIFKGLGGKVEGGELKVRSSGHKPGDNSDKLIYDKSDGSLWYDRDGSKKGYDALHFATLSGHPSLSAGDFDIV